MKFSINNFFLASLIFGRGVLAEVIKAKEGGIKDSYIVVLDERATRRHLRGTPDLGTTEFTTSAVNSLAFQIANNVGVMGSFSVAEIYSNSIVGFSMIGNEDVAEKFAADKYVAYVEQNQVFNINQQSGATWGLDRIDQRDLPLDSIYNSPRSGKGVAAYILDTGVQISHNEFGGRARWGANTSGDGRDQDCHGHGTHVAGTVGGSNYGVAKNAEIVAVKVLNCNGSGSTTSVINGIEWAASDVAAKGKPATANMSLIGGFSSALNAAVKALNNSGVPTVVPAGNNNANACDYSPASEPDVTTVGSTTNADTRSSFSNFGTCVDVFAPGSEIISAWVGNDDAIKTMSGTSMASPHVCGGVALLLEEGIAAADINEEILGRATKDKITDVQTGSHNELLFVGDNGPTDPPTPAQNIRFNKFGILDETFEDIPLGPDSYPISVDEAVVNFLKEGTDAESVVNDQSDYEVVYSIEELVNIVGGPPDHPSDDLSAPYWDKLNKVINMVQKKGTKKAVSALSNQMQLPLRWKSFSVNDVAEAVYDEYPGMHQAHFLEDLVQGKYGEIEFDTSIIPRRSNVQFLREIIMLGYLNTWSIGVVGPHNFGAKWYGGRARPEEVAWLIHEGIINAPEKTRNKIANIKNFTKATDFTRYDREGRAGSPRHPSWPAMHSAGSNMSFWVQIVMNLTPRQLCEAKKVDFAVSFARTVAGVHFEDDNMAGLNMGQEIVARALPGHFAEKYNSDIAVVAAKVAEKRFQWENYQALQDCDTL